MSLLDASHHHLASVGSTNDEAQAKFLQSDNAPVWVSADIQTTGRGRQGRAWTSPSGNLYASLAFAPDVTAAHIAELGFVCGLALHDALVETVPEITDSLKLKWPNDLKLGDAKLAGILLERHAHPENAGQNLIVAGFGVNVGHAPLNTPYPAASLVDAGYAVDPANLMGGLRRAMAGRVTSWLQAGFDPIRTDWMARAFGLGKTIRIKGRTGTDQSGIFAGIDGSGRLILRSNEGTDQLISAGDVWFGSATTSISEGDKRS